ncbi:dedicator of cytokinesis protein 5 [Manacus vitellinus]|uniref:dedicator of cytokinesis protein 5 n=1 Tax=Manacus vitellinus TaxID=328815 RepID=UPI00115C9594|nr:dedicator of cytokinesis protein 5 [Manacus vitellinus]
MYEGWYRGYTLRNKSKKGIFPETYIHLKEAIVKDRGQHETVIPSELPLGQELTSTLREWAVIWHKLYVNNKTTQFRHVQQLTYSLIEWRSQILSGTLPKDELAELKKKVTAKIDYGNRILGLDLVVRDDNGNILDPDETSTISLFKAHETASKRIDERIQEEKSLQQSLDLRGQPIFNSTHTYSLYVNFKNFVCNIGEDAELLMSLYDPDLSKFISENYLVRWGSNGMPKEIEKLNNLQAVFTDLSSSDLIRPKISLVCQIVRVGHMELKDGKKHTCGLRRPFGVAVMDITDIIHGKVDDEEKQHFIPFQQIAMETYIRQRQLIMSPLITSHVIGENEPLTSVFNKVIAAKEVNHKGQGLWVSLKLLPGDLAQVQKDFSHLVDRSTAVARKMGFPEIILPGGGEGCCMSLLSPVQVAIAIEEVSRCHLRFTFRHRSSQESRDRSERAFGVGFVKLMNADGTTLQDGKHNLIVYKGDNKKMEDAKSYLSLPCTKTEMEEREAPSGKNLHHLANFTPTKDSTKDSFQIATVICSTKLTQNVDLLGLLNWRSNSQNIAHNLRKLMEVEGGEIVKFLPDTLDALFNIMMEMSENETYDFLVFDALVFIISLIGDIKFQHFNAVLETYIYKHFSATLAYVKLTKVLNCYVGNAEDSSKTELLFAALKALKYLFRFIVQSRVLYLSVYGKSEDGNEFNDAIRKLFLSFNILMDRPLEEAVKIKGAALKYLPSIINDVKLVFDPVELSVLFSKFIQSIPDNQLVRQKLNCLTKIVESDLFRQAALHIQLIMERLLRRINRTVIGMSRQSPHIGIFVACMTAILRQMDDFHYSHYIKTFKTRQDIIDFLMETFIMFKDLIGKNVYAADWMVMNMMQSRVFLRAVNQFTSVLNQAFLDQKSFELQLWNNYFHLAVAFLTHESLQLETFSQAKRSKIIKKYGDMRKEIGFKIRDMWYNLVGIKWWWHFGSFRFENELITKLDQEVEGGRGDEQYKILLEKLLLEHCRKHKYLAAPGEVFALLVSSLLENLLDYRTIMHDESKENRMSCTVNVLNFYKEKKREDIYIRYLYKLRDLHTDCENFTEAAYTLLLHAELLQWSEKPCAPHLMQRDSFYVYSQQELKEKLYQEIISFFDRGKMWEKAIQLSKELADMYENKVFDYEGLGNLLKKRATFYENIMKAMRPQPEYFAVGYYGQGFPSFLRNKIFIYRGKEYERREDFNLKLLTQFPSAEKMTSTAPPGEDIKASPKQYVQCFIVKPVMNLPPNYKDKPVPEQILNYYRANEVQQFTHSRPVRKGEKDPDNEFATMWIERTTYTTAYSFPGILKWFEVKQVTTLPAVPQPRHIPCPCVQSSERSRKEQRAEIPTACKAFFTEKYLQEHPEDQDKIELLKQQIAIQMPLLAEGIRIHGEKLTEQLKPLHERLTGCFRELRRKVEKQYGVITLPPSLTERKPSRSGSVVLPYIMSSTLRRLSVTSVASSVVSTSSTSSDSTSSRPGSDGSILEPLLERRISTSSRAEEPPGKDDGDNRISKLKRKEWSISKSQVIVEKEPEAELTSKMGTAGKAQRPKSLQLGDNRLTLLQGSSLQQSTRSPPPITPKTPRTQSFPSLQADGLATPPPPPPKSKPYENSNPRNSVEVAPPLPSRREAKPPPPPPKTRKSSVVSSEQGLQ